MLKKVLTIAAASAFSSPCFAGFYVNVENNGSYTGKDYTGSGTDLHLGYENGNAFGSYYIQGGAYLNNPDGADSETNFSGNVVASKNIDVYGEFSIVTDDTNSYGTKVGLKYKF